MVKAKCISCEEEVKDSEDLYGHSSLEKYENYSGECENCGKTWPNSSSNFFVPVDSDYWDLEKPDYVNSDDEDLPDLVLEDEDHRCPSCGSRAFKYMHQSAGRMCIFCSFTS